MIVEWLSVTRAKKPEVLPNTGLPSVPVNWDVEESLLEHNKKSYSEPSSAYVHERACLRMLIVDDEPRERAAVFRLCEENGDVLIIGEAESGAAAIRAVEKLRPDVMVLEVDLPDMTGFDVLHALEPRRRPVGILVTAHSSHAVTAVSAGALDCLVKPLRADRFANAIERARACCGHWSEGPYAAQELQEATRPRDKSTALPEWKRVVGERQHRLYPLDPRNIHYIESDGNYVRICVGETEYISRDSIKRLSAEFSEIGLIRIDRSILVNIRTIQYVEALGHATFAFTLTSGVCLHSSANYRAAILRVLPLRRCRAGSRRIDA